MDVNSSALTTFNRRPFFEAHPVVPAFAHAIQVVRSGADYLYCP
jgi:hypothetical protein